MLFVRPKIVEPIFSLYARPLHPELFQVAASATIMRSRYEVRLMITNAGHVLWWTDGERTLTEVIAPAHCDLPGRFLFRRPLLGTGKECAEIDDSLRYRAHYRLEEVEPEMLAMIDRETRRPMEHEGLIYRFGGSGRVCFGAVSFIGTQSRQERLFVQAVHTFPDDLAILRCETTIMMSALSVS